MFCYSGVAARALGGVAVSAPSCGGRERGRRRREALPASNALPPQRAA